MSMETFTQQSPAQEKGQKILRLTQEEHQGQADAKEAGYIYRKILSEVGQNDMTSEKMKNYIDGLPKLFRTLPTSILESLEKQIENNSQNPGSNSYGAEIKKRIKDETEGHPRSWIKWGEWNGKKFEKEGYSEKLGCMLASQPKKTLNEWKGDCEDKITQLKDSKYSEHEDIQKILTFLNHQIKMINTETENRREGVEDSTSWICKAQILKGINNTTLKKCNELALNIAAVITSREEQKILKSPDIQTKTENEIQEEVKKYIQTKIEEMYMPVAEELTKSFETNGEPAGLVMSPNKFVKRIKKQAGILLDKSRKSDNSRISSMAA